MDIFSAVVSQVFFLVTPEDGVTWSIGQAGCRSCELFRVECCSFSVLLPCQPSVTKAVLDRKPVDHTNVGLQRSALHCISVFYYLKRLNCCVIWDDVQLTAKGLLFCDLIDCFPIKFVSLFLINWVFVTCGTINWVKYSTGAWLSISNKLSICRWEVEVLSWLMYILGQR